MTIVKFEFSDFTKYLNSNTALEFRSNSNSNYPQTFHTFKFNDFHDLFLKNRRNFMKLSEIWTLLFNKMALLCKKFKSDLSN